MRSKKDNTNDQLMDVVVRMNRAHCAAIMTLVKTLEQSGMTTANGNGSTAGLRSNGEREPLGAARVLDNLADLMGRERRCTNRQRSRLYCRAGNTPRRRSRSSTWNKLAASLTARYDREMGETIEISRSNTAADAVIDLQTTDVAFGLGNSSPDDVKAAHSQCRRYK